MYCLLAAATAAKSLQSCPTLCDPIDGSPPGSPIPGILKARTLEWVAISFSNAWEWKVKVKSLSHVPLFAIPWTAAHQAPPSMGFSRQEYWSGVPLPSLTAYLPHTKLCRGRKHQRGRGSLDLEKSKKASRKTWNFRNLTNLNFLLASGATIGSIPILVLAWHKIISSRKWLPKSLPFPGPHNLAQAPEGCWEGPANDKSSHDGDSMASMKWLLADRERKVFFYTVFDIALSH